MEEKYSINEILNAVNDLQQIKKIKKETQNQPKKVNKSSNEIPSDTLKLIEDAEKTIISKMQSE
tara:strand:+ start:2141 stop:2332 length:192 start_codon:yes stop_codon:yes gene_type:complete